MPGSHPDRLPPPPARPDDRECCGRGCCPCIFDYYEKALQRWRDKIQELGGDPESLLKGRGA
ncbi:hypothetical protein LJR225_002193 [Phenylobacterium sp. LjRoot225]|uniref:oxidoreductase-like domain-containing protein n=1 Tax=Phenylobacterium sp. LjRoot225 TaxID=3342285 RepID=UPI003ECECD22